MNYLLVAFMILCTISLIMSAGSNRTVPIARRNDWMKNYHDRNLLNMYIPGTHNSGAYRTKLLSVSNLKSVVGSIYHNFTITQDLNIYDQLQAGIRLLDIRVNTEIAGQPYISHTACCIPLKECFNHILQFLQKNPSEVIIILLKKDNYFNKINWPEVATLIDQYFHGIEIMPRMAVISSIGEIVDCKKRVAIINENDADIKTETKMWPREMVHNHWHNTTDVVKLTSAVRATNSNISSDRLHITDFIVTPTTNDIKMSLLPWTKNPRNLKIMNYSLLDTMTADLFPRPTACMIDFIDNKRIDTMIKLNEKK